MADALSESRFNCLCAVVANVCGIIGCVKIS